MGRQEDAHEYLVGLLDAMHEGVLAGVHPRPPRETAETSFIYRIFAGRLRSQVRHGTLQQRQRFGGIGRRTLLWCHAARMPPCLRGALPGLACVCRIINKQRQGFEGACVHILWCHTGESSSISGVPTQ